VKPSPTGMRCSARSSGTWLTAKTSDLEVGSGSHAQRPCLAPVPGQRCPFGRLVDAKPYSHTGARCPDCQRVVNQRKQQRRRRRRQG
jgi:hypothetical protein